MGFNQLYGVDVVPAVIVHQSLETSPPENLAYVGSRAVASLLRANRAEQTKLHIDFMVPDKMSVGSQFQMGASIHEWLHTPQARTGILFSFSGRPLDAPADRIADAFGVFDLGVELGIFEEYQAGVQSVLELIDCRLRLRKTPSDMLGANTQKMQLLRGLELERVGRRWKLKEWPVHTEDGTTDTVAATSRMLRGYLGCRLVQLCALSSGEIEPLDTSNYLRAIGAFSTAMPHESPPAIELLSPFESDPGPAVDVARMQDFHLDSVLDEPAAAASATSVSDVEGLPGTSVDMYLVARHPSHWEPNKRSFLNVRIACDPGADPSAMLKRFPVPAEGVEIAIRIDAGREVEIHSRISVIVRLMPNEDTDWIGFDLSMKRLGIHPVWITAIRDGQEVAQLKLLLEVTETVKGPSSEEKESRSGVSNAVGVPYDVARIWVTYNPEYERYELTWHSKGINLCSEMDKTFAPKKALASIREVIENIQAIARMDYDCPKAVMDAQMQGSGLRLWEQIIPENIKSHYFVNPNRYKTIHVISGGDPVPWELIVPKTKVPGIQQNFWGVVAGVRRWFWGEEPASDLLRGNAQCPDGSRTTPSGTSSGCSTVVAAAG